MSIVDLNAEPAAFPLRVRVPAGTCRLDRDSDVLVDLILAWDNTLFRDDLGELPAKAHTCTPTRQSTSSARNRSALTSRTPSSPA